jgi:mono/diheme cytochrome c family protein
VDVPSVVSNYKDGDFTDTLEMFTEIDGKPFSPGKLVAFDPVTGRARWTVNHELPFNGGVMATGGTLVFQGDAAGNFSAYNAGTGEQLWSVATGSSITAAPASYSIADVQYVLIPVGSGGGLQFVYPEMHSANGSKGPTRLLAFSLDGHAEIPMDAPPRRALPAQPELEARPQVIQAGHGIYASNCGGCHGKNAVARAGGTVPDLRYANADTHATWQAIVIGGSRRASGMPAMELSVDDAEAVRAYVLSLSEQLRGR